MQVKCYFNTSNASKLWHKSILFLCENFMLDLSIEVEYIRVLTSYPRFML
jgi:hypothetical protein